ncbi:MAG: hypothetical protein V9E94_07760 [Microthrixaceae bacterium]
MDEAAPLDGRRVRGAESRRTILAAASAVIVEDGVGGLSHRVVAERAGVPLARVGYHFPTVDDLMIAATARYLDEFDERLASMAASAVASGRPLAEACADFLEELIGPGAREFLAMVEVRLALHRRGLVVDDTDSIVKVLRGFGAREQQIAPVVASLFGFALLAATTDTPVPRQVVKNHVHVVFEGAAHTLEVGT